MAATPVVAPPRGPYRPPAEPGAGCARGGRRALARGRTGRAIVLGRDRRPLSPPLAEASADGAGSRGGDGVALGLASPALLCVATGSQDLLGGMLAASQN